MATITKHWLELLPEAGRPCYDRAARIKALHVKRDNLLAQAALVNEQIAMKEIEAVHVIKGAWSNEEIIAAKEEAKRN